MNKALIFATGLVLGAVGGYFVARKVGAKELEEEINSVKQEFEYNRKAKDYSNDVAEKPAEEYNDIPVKSNQKKEKEYVDYTKYVSATSPEEMVEQMAADVKRSKMASFTTSSLDTHVVTREEFEANEEEYDKISLTYFEGDETVVDMHNDIFEDAQEYIGEDFPNHFDDGVIDKAYDTDVVYVKNERLEIYYEILRDERSFKEVSQGI